MRAAAVLTLTLVLLWAVMAEANTALAPLQLWLFAGGLFVAGPALAAPAGGGAAVFLAGCLCDAYAPRELFGAQAVLFTAAYLVLRGLRGRLPRGDTFGRVAAVLAVNFALFAAVSLLRLDLYPAAGPALVRLFADLAASEAFVALAAPWFFALEDAALAWTGADSAAGH
jgi:hypothetical protein